MDIAQTKKEFSKFLFVGCVNTLIGVVLSTIMTIKFNELTAFLIGYYLSLIISYFLNSKFVFEENYSLNKLIKFKISYIPNFIIQVITVYVLVENLDVIPFIIYGLSAAISVPITFVMLKILTFKRGNN